MHIFYLEGFDSRILNGHNPIIMGFLITIVLIIIIITLIYGMDGRALSLPPAQ
ncbi:MAG: hypothetical protein K0S76_768 [Herbinix sp.]|jgi:hypothetical protein|nr:hypothetical protein [Herbinix sp.]